MYTKKKEKRMKKTHNKNKKNEIKKTKLTKDLFVVCFFFKGEAGQGNLWKTKFKALKKVLKN